MLSSLCQAPPKPSPQPPGGRPPNPWDCQTGSSAPGRDPIRSRRFPFSRRAPPASGFRRLPPVRDRRPFTFEFLRNAQPPHGFLFQRHRYRPGYRQHARLRPRSRHRPARALGRRRQGRHQHGAGRRQRGQAHARAHARSNIVAVRPLKDGVIADFEITEAMLRHFITKVHNRRKMVRPRVVIAVPSGITEVEKRAVKESPPTPGRGRSISSRNPWRRPSAWACRCRTRRAT